MSDSSAYLAAVSDILASGRPNYRGCHIPLPSVFNWKYIEKHIGSYHDGRLLDYLKFGFLLSIQDRSNFRYNATKIHHSAISYSHEIDSFLEKELQEGAIFGPFNEISHPEFMWSPLITRRKGNGRQVILDLSYGENSTSKETFDESTFKLTLPSLDNLLPALRELGPDARLYKIDISRAFQNVPVDPCDAIHLGMMWKDKYYIEKFLAFGPVHGTGIFQRITDFVRFNLVKEGIEIYNYIDDIYACCHRDQAEEAFQKLKKVIMNLGEYRQSLFSHFRPSHYGDCGSCRAWYF